MSSKKLKGTFRTYDGGRLYPLDNNNYTEDRPSKHGSYLEGDYLSKSRLERFLREPRTDIDIATLDEEDQVYCYNTTMVKRALYNDMPVSFKY
jgi:hypothetical protein